MSSIAKLRLELPPRTCLSPNGPSDPLDFYYRRSVGWLYRHRLQMGLDLVPASGRRVLEVGVGCGILVPTLTRNFADYLGTDLILAPGLAALVAPGCRAAFAAADLLQPDSLPEAAFDVIVCFSVLEHIADADGAARSLARALASGGTLVTGYPMVSWAMTRAFEAIGYHGIDDHHVSPPVRIEAALRRHLTPRGRAAFPPCAPTRLALYTCTSWTRL